MATHAPQPPASLLEMITELGFIVRGGLTKIIVQLRQMEK